MSTFRASLFALAILSLTSTSAHAGPGLRVGVTNDADALFAGLQWRVPLGQAGPGKLLLQPGADVGIVDGPVDLFIRGTLHFAYVLPLTSDVAIYPLAGPTLIWATYDGGSDTDLGVDVGVGLQFQSFALELWIGAVDSFDATLALSFNL